MATALAVVARTMVVATRLLSFIAVLLVLPVAVTRADSSDDFSALQRQLFSFSAADQYPAEAVFVEMGDHYVKSEDYRAALKYYSLGLHINPYNYEIRERIDGVKSAQEDKAAVSMCKWRGNVFTQTHEISTALGMVHASQNRIEESMVFFFASVERSFKDAMTAHSNLAVSAYRLAIGEKTNAKRRRSLMTIAYHAIHHNVQKLDSNNHGVLRHIDQWFAALPAKDQARVKKKKLVPPKVAVCGKSSMYSYGSYNFIEGMLLLRGNRWHEAEIMLTASYEAEPDTTTAAALAWVSFQRERPLAGLQWLERCDRGSRVYNDLQRLDWQEKASQEGDDVEVYNLSEDPEAHRSNAHVAGAGGNVDSWTEFLGTWWKRQTLELAKIRNGTENILQSRAGIKNSRFLIGYLPDVGLGNQVTSLVSYVVMAMLMDRALLLYWPDALDHNFKNLQDSIQLQLQNWELEDSAPYIRLDLAVRYSQTIVFMEDAYAQDTDFFQALVCGDLNEYATAPFVYALTNQNLFRMLEANPLYETKLRDVFGENLYGILTTWLMKPRPHIQTFVDRYVENFFEAEPNGFTASSGDESVHVIGVHMRSGMVENSQDVKILFVNNREPVYEGLIDNIGDIVEREKAIIRAQGGSFQTTPRLVIFMAVDNAELKTRASQWLRDRYGSSAVVSVEDGRKVINASVDTRIERHSTAGMAGAVLDMLILSRCHSIVRVGKALSLFTSLAASQMKDARSRVYYAPPTRQCAATRLPHPMYGVAFSGQQSRIAINEGVVMEHNMLRCWEKGPMDVVRHLAKREWLYPGCDSVTGNFTSPVTIKDNLPQLLQPRPRI